MFLGVVCMLYAAAVGGEELVCVPGGSMYAAAVGKGA